MKTLHIPLEDKDYKALIKAKKDKTWHEFLIEVARKINGYSEKEENILKE